MAPATVTDDAVSPTITAGNDIRIRIPATFNMLWDTTDVTATITGSAASKVSSSVSYEDGGKTLVLDVTTDFSAGEEITVSALSFTSFTAASAADQLELEVYNDDVVTAEDTKNITIVEGPSISSGANQVFAVGDPPTLASTITVTEAPGSRQIKRTKDIRIRIPATFNMTWDPSVTSVTLGGPAASKVSATLLPYEDGNKTVVIDVTTDFLWDEALTIAGLKFTSFTAASPLDNLELEVHDNGLAIATDDKTIEIGVPGPQPSLSSAANQIFWVGKAATAISLITVTDAGAAPSITAANDLRVRIPAGFNMSWDVSDVTATIGGSAAAKVSTTVSYEDGGKTLVVDVTTNFVSGDAITISGLSFLNFTATSGADNLELEVYNDDTVTAEDDKTIQITAAGTPTISSEFDQSFRVGDPPIAMSNLTVTDDASKPVITAANDIRVRIPAGFNMTWDTSDNTATIIGTAAGKVSTTVSYEDGGKTLVIDVTTDFAAGDLITIADLSFTSFTAESPDDNLELEVLNDGTVAAEDDQVIFIVFIISTPSLASADDQLFTVGDPPTLMIVLRITDDPVPIITATGDLRIRIPAGISMIWDTLAVTPSLSGRGRSKVSNTVSYEDNGKTMVIDVLSNFAPDDWLNVKEVNFLNFASATPARRLELDINNDGFAETVDVKTKQILGPSYGVYVTPDTTAQSQLPSNGTNYTVNFNVANIGSVTDDYDLLTTTIPGSAITVISITGPGVTQGANPDSARLSGLVSTGVAVVTVTYSVADVALGTTDTLVFTARSVGNPAESDNGRLELTVVRPNVTTSKAVNPAGTPPPGTDLTYTITVANVGSANAVSLVTVDSLATEVQFQVGSVVNTLPAGVGVVVEYSNDDGATWTYTPVSSGCGAPATYDDCVTHIRWTLQTDLSPIAPDNTGEHEFVARVK